MSISLHAIFKIISGNEYFVIVVFIFRGRKMRFSESSQNSMSEKSIFGHFEVFLSTYKNFPGRGWCFLLVHLKRSLLKKR